MGLNGLNGKSTVSHCQSFARGAECNGPVGVGALDVVGESPSGTKRQAAPNESVMQEEVDEIAGSLERCIDGALTIGRDTYAHSFDERNLLAELMSVDIRRLGLDAVESDAEGSEAGATIRSARAVSGDSRHSGRGLGAVRSKVRQHPARIRPTVTGGGCVAVTSPSFAGPVAIMTLDGGFGASGRGSLRRIGLEDLFTYLVLSSFARGELRAKLGLSQVLPRLPTTLVKVASAARGPGIVSAAVRPCGDDPEWRTNARVVPRKTGGAPRWARHKQSGCSREQKLARDTLTVTGKAAASDTELLFTHRASSRCCKVLGGVLVRRGFEGTVARGCLEGDRVGGGLWPSS